MIRFPSRLNRSQDRSAVPARPRRQGTSCVTTPGFRTRHAADSRRSGAVLIVVLGLLGLLMLLGFFFYTFANQEQGNAEYFAEAAKEGQEVGISSDLLFDWGLKQIIVGADDQVPQSSLWGGRHSLMANAYGRDIHPFSGQGIHVRMAGNGLPFVDQNYDDSSDNSSLLELMDTKARDSGVNARALDASFPEPDADYTYPDINSTFLAFRGYAYDASNNPIRVIIPSFHRPQYLRELDGGGAAVAIRNWHTRTGSNMGRKVMRAHPDHRAVNVNDGTTSMRRYLTNDSSSLQYANDTNWLISGVGMDAATAAATPRFDFEFSDQNQGVWDMQEWRPSTTYQVGQYVVPTGSGPVGRTGLVYRCTAAGTSDTTNEPSWPTTDGNTIQDGSPGTEITWEAMDQPQYTYDADADGDNIKEAVYLDLGFPPQEFEGRTIVPLYAMTIYDADGLANLNAHGNLEGDINLAAKNAGTEPFGNGGFLSKSNRGRSHSEVNVQQVLNARPGADRIGTTAENFQQLNYFFGNDPSTSDSQWGEVSNMEYFLMNVGRLEFQSPGSYTDVFAGRLGELDRVVTGYQTKNAAAFGQPGRVQVDDNGNRNVGEGLVLSGELPYGNPFDFTGVGNDYQAQTDQLDRPLMYTGYGTNGNPSTWHVYNRYNSRGTVAWAQYLSGNLMQNSEDGLLDEMFELIPEREHASAYDDIFDPSENAFLQMSNSDVSNTGIAARLETLMNYNLRKNARAQQIRRNLTTESWDPRFFGFTHFPSSGPTTPGNRGRKWEFTNTGSTNKYSQPIYRFPPTISGVADHRQPFRSAIRELFKLQTFDNISGSPRLTRQRRMDINQYFYFAGGQLRSRHLTNHPTNATTAESLPQQEVLARRDRQHLARDIYVMLYVLGGGRDDVNYLTQSNSPTSSTMSPGWENSRPLYTDSQLEQMAQFAVNYVDALDRDNVITKFEYDKNLGPSIEPGGMSTSVTNLNDGAAANGWDLDDDPDTNDFNEDVDDPQVERGVVYGVEAQSLTFSETLAIRAAEVPGSDHTRTTFDDMSGRHNYLHIELRNVAPYEVPIASSASNDKSNATWRIRVIQGGDVKNMLYFLQNANQRVNRNPGGGYGSLINTNGIAAGGQYIIGTSDGDDQFNNNKHRPSDFRVDYDEDDDFDLIAPHFAESSPPTLSDVDDENKFTPRCDLDLVHERDESLKFELDTNNGDKGALIDWVGQTTSGYTLILERRCNVDLPRVGATYNPWVEVDRMGVTVQDFSINQSSSSSTFPTLLQNLRSRERKEPFDRSDVQEYTTGSSVPNKDDNHRRNSLGLVRNTNSPNGAFTRWQYHLDRDYMSVVELFNIPLYGPNDTTASVELNGANTAGGGKFLRPDYIYDLSGDPNATNTRLDNRWYRLLNFLEVSPAYTRPVGVARSSRVPGRINWNTIRDPGVWAALIDDNNVFTQNFGAGGHFLRSANLANSINGSGERDWWIQFIRARDGQDSTTGLYLPGTASSRPFRSFSHTADGNGSIEETMLRSLPQDSPVDYEPNRRRLLELGQRDTNNRPQYMIRHRLMEKVLGNSTTRSNVFFVFMKIDFFALYEDGSGNQRIGALQSDIPSVRGFFVVDRSKAFDLLQSSDFSDNSSNARFALKNSFDWRQLVEHRLQIE